MLHQRMSLIKLRFSTAISQASGNKSEGVGAVHASSVPEEQMDLGESVKNRTNVICSQLAKSSPSETSLSGDTGIANTAIVGNS